MTKIKIILTIGGEHETEVVDYNAKSIATEIANTTESVVAIGDVIFNKGFFVSTSPVRESEETVE